MIYLFIYTTISCLTLFYPNIKICLEHIGSICCKEKIILLVPPNLPPPPPSGLSAAVGSLSFYVKKGIACWSSSGFHTLSTTSINAGGLTITDSKIFQSPSKTSTRNVFFFVFFFFVLAYMSTLIKNNNKKQNF